MAHNNIPVPVMRVKPYDAVSNPNNSINVKVCEDVCK